MPNDRPVCSIQNRALGRWTAGTAPKRAAYPFVIRISRTNIMGTAHKAGRMIAG
jgi:hypothetical protein